MRKPTNADYKFFYKIMEQYSHEYGPEATIDTLPEFMLDPRDSIEEALHKVSLRIDLLGEPVCVNVPVRTVMMDMNCQTVLETLRTTTEMTYGHVIKAEGDSYTVQYKTPTGVYLETIFPKKDIIAFGEHAKELRLHTWNGEFQEDEDNV